MITLASFWFVIEVADFTWSSRWLLHISANTLKIMEAQEAEVKRCSCCDVSIASLCRWAQVNHLQISPSPGLYKDLFVLPKIGVYNRNVFSNKILGHTWTFSTDSKIDFPPH